MKFKTGDRVICTNIDGCEDSLPVGKEFVIVSVKNSTFLPYYAEDSSGVSEVFNEDELELVE